MSNNTTEIDEDVAEIIISHFPNASRKVMQEMAVELHKLLVEARLDELRKVGLHHDEYYIQRLESLKSSLEGEEV